MKPLLTGSLLLLILLWVHLTQGRADASLNAIGAIFSPDNSESQNLIRHLLLPRSAIGVLAGMALGIAGTLLQTMTRNPLASPTTLGVNAGAYFGIVASAIFIPEQLAIRSAITTKIADTIGRVILAPKEIPSGLVTATIGTPDFIWLLWQSRS